jgi:hypothetical protein
MESEEVTIEFLPPEGIFSHLRSSILILFSNLNKYTLVLVNVFCRLDIVTLVRDVARVCSTWRSTLTYDTIFQRIFTRLFGSNAANFKHQMELDQFTWRSLVRVSTFLNFSVFSWSAPGLEHYPKRIHYFVY